MTSAKITRVETVKRGENATLFNPFTEPITLRLTVVVSGGTPSQPMVMDTLFQIVAFHDNQIKFQGRTVMNISPSGSEEYYTWVDLGTAHDLGLVWGIGMELYGFRGAVELYNHTGEPNSIYNVDIDAFDVSEIHWFRLEHISTL